MTLARWASFLPPVVREQVRRAAPPGLVVDTVELPAWDLPVHPDAAVGDAAARDDAVGDDAVRVEVATSWVDRFAQASPHQAASAVQMGQRSPRCLIVTGSLDVGGMDAFVEFLAEGLPRHGLGVHLAVMADAVEADGRIARSLRDRGLVVDSLGRPDAGEVHRLPADVVSIHGAPDWAVEALSGLGVPMVETLHGMHTIFSAEDRQLERRGALLEGVVAVSELVRQQYLARCRALPEARTTTIPNGVHSSRLQRDWRPEMRRALGVEGRHLFVSLARHCMQKNTYGLVDAFCDFVERGGDADLVVAGHAEDQRYTAQVLALKDRRPGGCRVHVRGHAIDPRRLLAAADCFVLDSFFEGWSLASMEALTAGLPVVTSDVGGAREQLELSGHFGVLVPNPLGDPLAVDWGTMGAARFRRQANRDELVDALATAVEQSESWAGAREEIARRAAAAFDPEVCLQRHAEVLLSAMAPGRADSSHLPVIPSTSRDVSEESLL
jgi:glycosyltransferase involved in cell wall biosynthesis